MVVNLGKFWAELRVQKMVELMADLLDVKLAVPMVAY